MEGIFPGSAPQRSSISNAVPFCLTPKLPGTGMSMHRNAELSLYRYTVDPLFKAPPDLKHEAARA